MERTRELAEAGIGRLMLKYFIPAFVGVFVNALYNIVDRIFIGQGVGALALAGISVIFPVMLIIISFGLLIGIGSSVLVSINLGKRDLATAEYVLGNCIVLIVLISSLITGAGFLFKDPLLRVFGATSETIEYANDYLKIILWGTFFQQIGFGLNHLIRAEGNAKIAMHSMLISAGANLILDPLFIFVFDMGVKGAAYATVISMAILAVWVFFHFSGSRSVVKIHWRNLRLDPAIVKGILAVGMAPFFMQTANSAVQGLVNSKLISFGGDLAVGAMGIVNSVSTMIIMSVIAINMASQPIVGFNFGARQYQRVKDTLRIALIASTLISLVAFILVESFPAYIVRLFNAKDPDLLAIGSQGLRLSLLALPVVGFQVVGGNFFQSVGKAKISSLLTLLRQVIILIPLLFVLPDYFDLPGIWIAMPVSDVLSAFVVAYFLAREWKLLTAAATQI